MIVRLVLLSDTHLFHRRLELPAGDVLIHAGDFCGSGRREQVVEFAAFFRALPHRHKIVIAGNHDRALELDPDLGPALFEGCHYLLDAGVTIEGLSVWGSPWQPEYHSMAFNLPRGRALRERWALIPTDVDVLVTHGPPHGILDRTLSDHEAGCDELLAALQRVRPRLHVFGHIHEGYGRHEEHGTLFVNASICTPAYEPTNPPVVVDLQAG